MLQVLHAGNLLFSVWKLAFVSPFSGYYNHFRAVLICEPSLNSPKALPNARKNLFFTDSALKVWRLHWHARNKIENTNHGDVYAVFLEHHYAMKSSVDTKEKITAETQSGKSGIFFGLISTLIWNRNKQICNWHLKEPMPCRMCWIKFDRIRTHNACCTCRRWPSLQILHFVVRQKWTLQRIIAYICLRLFCYGATSVNSSCCSHVLCTFEVFPLPVWKVYSVILYPLDLFCRSCMYLVWALQRLYPTYLMLLLILLVCPDDAG